MRYFISFLIVIIVSLAPLFSFAGDLTFDNPRVIDGDTISVTLSNLPPPLNKLSIRLYGIDTPELRGKCANERALAIKARDFLKILVNGNDVVVKDYSWDKYGGRIVGKAYVNNLNLSTLMIVHGIAMPYYGVGAKTDWCQMRTGE
jgi:micrococcal nuclease